jgi:hypothetical protein
VRSVAALAAPRGPLWNEGLFSTLGAQEGRRP